MKKPKTKLDKVKESFIAAWNFHDPEEEIEACRAFRRDLNRVIKLAKQEAIKEQRQTIINLENPERKTQC